MIGLIDTVCYENGKFQRLELHNNRINRSRKDLFGLNDELQIEGYLSVPSCLESEIVKCRITYSSEIEKIEYEKYVMKPIHSLKLINGDHIDYAYKYSDRSQLTQLFQSKGEADDILIVRAGFITDTSYANIVFLKEGAWITPSAPLLNGTRRESYLRSGRITIALIRPEDLAQFSEARIINAMIPLEQSPIIKIQNICG